MMSPIQTTIPQVDGSDRYVIIEPILEKYRERGLHSTGVFKIYKDAFGDETQLFTEPKELDEVNDDLPDDENPDYLGKFTFQNGSVRHFEGHVLSLAEQAYLAVFIEAMRSPMFNPSSKSCCFKCLYCNNEYAAIPGNWIWPRL